MMSSYFVWPIQKINAARNKRIIRKVMESEVQPASIDIALDEEIWRIPFSFLPGANRKVMDVIGSQIMQTQRLSHYDAHSPTAGAFLEHGSVYLAKAAVSLNLPANVDARANPKSSSGRIDLFTRVLVDGATAFDTIPLGYEGDVYVEIAPRSFPVRMWRDTALGQLRFREHPEVMPAVTRGREPVTIDLDPTDKPDGIVGYRVRRYAGVVDLGRRDHPIEDYWEPVRLNASGGVTLEPEAFYIFMSKEAVSVSANDAAELVAYDIGLGEMRCHYAGFIDPGFGITDGKVNGSRLVLEVRGHDVPFQLTDGQRVATLEYEPLMYTATTLYGEDINSNYQGQGLKLSKHFR